MSDPITFKISIDGAPPYTVEVQHPEVSISAEADPVAVGTEVGQKMANYLFPTLQDSLPMRAGPDPYSAARQASEIIGTWYQRAYTRAAAASLAASQETPNDR